MILGRHPNLWLGFLTAVWNVIVLVGILTISAELSAGVNILLGSFILLLANTSSLTIDAGRAAIRKEAEAGNSTAAPR